VPAAWQAQTGDAEPVAAVGSRPSVPKKRTIRFRLRAICIIFAASSDFSSFPAGRAAGR
jgi:hypothetical protein